MIKVIIIFTIIMMTCLMITFDKVGTGMASLSNMKILIGLIVPVSIGVYLHKTEEIDEKEKA
jgi:hypothetical protein